MITLFSNSVGVSSDFGDTIPLQTSGVTVTNGLPIDTTSLSASSTFAAVPNIDIQYSMTEAVITDGSEVGVGIRADKKYGRSSLRVTMFSYQV